MGKVQTKQILNQTQVNISLMILLLIAGVFFFHTVDSARLTRAVMVTMSPNLNNSCTDLTITKKNSTSSIILTGTVNTCSLRRGGFYDCRLQIWRIIKGEKIASDLIVEQKSFESSIKKLYTNVYGLGNPFFCESNVDRDDTRIFFLVRANDRLTLSASLLRITFSNLLNTQDVVDGKEIIEVPKKPYDPCLSVLCGFGAYCVVDNGSVNCACPELSCGSTNAGDDLFTPVCGSNGVTYPNKCRLKAAQCMAQKRISVISNNICEPVIDLSSCNSVTCGNSAVCVVHIDKNGQNVASCQCPTCDEAAENFVCGSDQETYNSECALRRNACLHRKNISVVRNSPCNPCQIFTSDGENDLDQCLGQCSFDNVSGKKTCCDAIKCRVDDISSVCGSDGNTYVSQCALKRHACMTARNISILHYGSCPDKKAMTDVTGFISFMEDQTCPGNCSRRNNKFRKFIRSIENNVNARLDMQNREDIDNRKLSNFHVIEVRSGSVVLVFKLEASTKSLPIDFDDEPRNEFEWVQNRLFDEENGAITGTLKQKNLSLSKDKQSNIAIEEVCIDIQCNYGAACSIEMHQGKYFPTCSCDTIGDPSSLPVNMACMRGSDGNRNSFFFENGEDYKKQTCLTHSIFTLKNICSEILSDPCEINGGCNGVGQVCILMNGEGRCECISCGNVDEPVCGSDGITYRSECELQRQSCLSETENVSVVSSGSCESRCDGVKCLHGSHCEVLPQGVSCVCPAECNQFYIPVCGSDCITYNNQCEMLVESCKNKEDLSVIHQGPCGDVDYCNLETSGEPEAVGSGVDDCGCMFGGVCGEASDDEDQRCVCFFNCATSPSNEVCGSNGVTYRNECEMLLAQCNLQQAISIAASGSCAESCQRSVFGCCQDQLTPAKGFANAGCPETCRCNSHGSFGSSCDAKTGQCACRPGVGGLQCDRCRPGFWDFRGLVEGESPGCKACNCHEHGSIRDDCQQMTGRCQCKDGVKGLKCSQCSRDGFLVTSTGCQSFPGDNGFSCGNMQCRPEQECVDMNGKYHCQCPRLSSCDDFVGNPVCGSNGLTYPDICQMKVMACKLGVHVTVTSSGACQAATTSTNVAIFPSSTTTTIVTSGSTSSASMSTALPFPPSTTSIATAAKIPNDEIESSAFQDCEYSDDEDCLGSGEVVDFDLTPLTTSKKMTSSTDIFADSAVVSTTSKNFAPPNPITQENILENNQAFKMTGVFQHSSNVHLVYDEVLINPNSVLFKDYSRRIIKMMNGYLNNRHIKGKISSINLIMFDEYKSFWNGNGVMVTFVIFVSNGTSVNNLQSELNYVTNRDHSFEITELTANEDFHEDLDLLTTSYISNKNNEDNLHKDEDDVTAVNAKASELSATDTTTSTPSTTTTTSTPSTTTTTSTPSTTTTTTTSTPSTTTTTTAATTTTSTLVTTTTTSTIGTRTTKQASKALKVTESIHAIATERANEEKIKVEMEGYFLDVDDVKLLYDDQLTDHESNIYNEYSQLIKKKLNEYIDGSTLQQVVSSFNIIKFEKYYKFWYGNRVKVTLTFYVTFGKDPSLTDLEDELNDLSSGRHSFEITKMPEMMFPLNHYAYKMTGIFRNINGESVEYDEELLNNPESGFYKQVTQGIAQKLNDYIDEAGLRDSVVSFTIVKFGEYTSFWYDDGLLVTFNIEINHETSPSELQNKLSQVSNDKHSFEVVDTPEISLVKPNQPNPTEAISSNVTFMYNEDSTWVVPQFSGSSFLELPSSNSLTTDTVRIRFSSYDNEGLLFLSIQNQTKGDFLSVAIRNGQVEFRFDAGSGMLKLRSNVLVNDSRWHELVVRRNRREAMLMVDNETRLRGTSPPGSSSLNTNGNFFVGGIKSQLQQRLQDQVGVSKGITGCISNISVQDEDIPIQSNKGIFNMTHRISECGTSPCYLNQCENGANCFVISRHGTYAAKCSCRSGYQGELCRRRRDPCSSLYCHPSSSCGLDSSGAGYVCFCAQGRVGSMCEREVVSASVSMPGFAEDSYLKRKSMGKISKLTIHLVYYSSQPNGLIFYNSQKKSRKGNFVALSLKEKLLMFSYDVGEGPIIIRSSKPAQLNQWHRVQLSLNRRKGEMVVDGSSAIKKIHSNESFMELQLKQPLYLGGVPAGLKIPSQAGVAAGLTGSLQKFMVNGENINLDVNTNQYNVQPFNAHVCYHGPCLHGGTCVPQLEKHKCYCKDGWKGKRCDKSDK